MAQRTVPAKGHTEVVDNAIAATCTESGLTEGKHCSVCGEVLVAQQIVPAKGHTEVVDNAVAATCTESGLTEGKHCSVCGDVLVAQQTIPANGHTIVIDAAVAATSTTTGLTEGSHCSVCNAEIVPQTIIPMLAENGNDNNGNQSGNNGRPINYNEWFSAFEPTGYLAEQPATENGMYVVTVSDNVISRWDAQFCNVLHGLEGQTEGNPFKLTLDVKWESKTNTSPAVIYLLTGKLIRNMVDEPDYQIYQYSSENTEIVIDNSDISYCFLPFEVYNNEWTTIEVNGTIGEKGVDLIGLEFDLAVSNDAYVNAGKFYFKNIEIDLGGNKYYYYADVLANNDSGNNDGTNIENGNNNGNGNPNGNNGGTNNGGHNNGNGNQGNNNGGTNNGGANNGNGNQGGNNGGANNGGSNNGHRPNVPVTDPVSAVINQIYNVINLIHDLTTDVDENAAAKIIIYTINGNTIVVENADAEIFVYDAMGRLVCRNDENLYRTELQINGSGIYIVKVGNVAKRVMVN